MTAELQRVSNGPDQVLIEEAYMAGYLEAVEHEKRRKQAIKEKREKKKYFLTQKLYGVAILIFTAVAVKILKGGCHNYTFNGSFRCDAFNVKRNADYK